MTPVEEMQCTRVDERMKITGEWYNCLVQVAAEQTISYTVDYVIGVEPLPPCR